MTVTANTIIRDALALIGAIGKAEAPEADDAQPALRNLNRMIDAWAVRSLFAYHIGYESFSLPAATATRTLGPSGDVNITRPVRIESGAYVRVGGNDYHLESMTRQQFAEITVKTLGDAWPSHYYYDAASPLATINFHPQGACTVYLPVQTRLSQFADLTTEYTLPPGYEDALVLSLAERECLPNMRPVPVTLRQDARNARALIQATNLQTPQLAIGERVEFGQAAFTGG